MASFSVFCVLAVSILMIVPATEGVKISAFNVQIFGRNKASKPEVMAVLVKIVRRYDIILIQEIRDSSQTAIYELLEQVNGEGGAQYAISLSDRLGRTSSKEQYAYLYKVGTGISVTQQYQYPDTLDKFQREPYAVKFSIDDLGIESFAVAGIHTDPDEAVDEINELDKVHDAIYANMGTENIIIMGDFNADCTYVSKTAMKNLILRTDGKYNWLIPDSMDTTTSNTDCAYDRFVLTGDDLNALVVPGSANVFRYDLEYDLDVTATKAVSDHYPIEMELSQAAGNCGKMVSMDSLVTALKNWFARNDL